METGIYIRAEVNGKWGNYDIADHNIPTEAILAWLRSRGGKNVWAENTVLILLGRKQIAKED